MTKKELKNLKVGDFVVYDLDLIEYEVLDVDKNGFMTADGIYRLSIEDFDIRSETKKGVAQWTKDDGPRKIR